MSLENPFWNSNRYKLVMFEHKKKILLTALASSNTHCAIFVAVWQGSESIVTRNKIIYSILVNN